ncbi:hypothetical protein [Terrabacter terrigena]|uniref:Peptidase MA-like domain-containing protein n=1 Tax=Terrabacter terrigena TaxID=574718 RepID=A0ABW3MTJ2_9MICO
MPSQTQRPTAALRRSAATTSALAALSALAFGACTPAPSTRADAPATSSVSSVSSASPASSPRAATSTPSPGAEEIPPEQWEAVRRQSVTALLRDRLAAVQRDDLQRWLAPLGGSSKAALRRSQAEVLDRMTAIGVDDVQLVALRETTAPVPAPAGTSVAWDVRVSLTYRIRGFDTAPRAFDLDLTLKADPASPRRPEVTASAPSGRPQPWDLTGLRVRRSPTALVLAVGDDARLEEISRRARTAASRVATVWGSARPAVWIAPVNDADAARLLGRTDGPAGLGGVAAATDGPLTPGERAGADRIILVPKAWTSLRPDGRDVVMTHELTHVTVRGSTTRGVPVWLSEGFAELVAYTPIDLPETAVVAPALALVRARGMPTALPADDDFAPGTPTLQAAYGLSLLALRTLADAHGTRAVVDLYRAAAGGLAVPIDRVDDREGIVDDALRSTVGTTRGRLVKDWQARLRGLLR